MKEFDFEDVKKFVDDRLEDAEMWANTRQEVMNCRAIAFGVIMFAQRIWMKEKKLCFVFIEHVFVIQILEKNLKKNGNMFMIF